MRLPRPYIPIDVRLEVAARQLGHTWSILGQSRKEKLRLMLRKLFGDQPAHLDHDPALENRVLTWADDGFHYRYFPDANDPDFLIYRPAGESREPGSHFIKTYVRGDGAQYSDAALARKNKRIEKKKRQKKREWPKRKLRSANRWPKGKRYGRTKPARHDRAGFSARASASKTSGTKDKRRGRSRRLHHERSSFDFETTDRS